MDWELVLEWEIPRCVLDDRLLGTNEAELIIAIYSVKKLREIFNIDIINKILELQLNKNDSLFLIRNYLKVWQN